MTVAQSRALSYLLETHGECPVSSSANGGVVLVFVKGSVVTIDPDGTFGERKVVRDGKS